MLAELALCSAAFNTVKEFIQNGKELHQMGEGIIKYFDAKSALQKKVNKVSGDKSDLEEFLALEQIKAQEDELRELMIYTGRAGMWQDWLKFQSEAAQRRKEAELQAIRDKAKRDAKIYEWFEMSIAGILVILCVGILFWIVTAIAMTI
tara:strand:- start:62 stop:508 length:447 start_codon:yes stop_codon:yes gene_type:complete